jgi:hypothetical protein
MVFPRHLDDDPREDREEDLEDRAEWLDEVEDAYIAQGDVTVSETADGHDPTPDLDDEDAFENAFDEAMHEGDLD